MIQFTCPCGKALHARDDYAGETTRCPDCGRDVIIPGGEAVQSADAPRAAGRPPAEGDFSEMNRHDADRQPRPQPTTTSGKAVASIILGVLSLTACSVVAGLPAILFGALGLGDIGRGQGRVKGKGLAIAGIVTGALSFLCIPVLIGLLLPAVQKVREAAARMQSTNNLKQIVLAMHDYASVYNDRFPPAALCDTDGKPLLSWRVAILPYIEEAPLYSQFKLDEPWDGPNNSKLLAAMPKIYLMPGDATAQPGYTHYRVFVGHGAAFDPPQPARGPNPFGSGGVPLRDFTDGTSSTILVVEAATAVPWTKPEELDYDPNGPLPALGGHFSGIIQAAMADGSVRMIPKDVSEQTLRAAITRNAGDALGPDW